MDLFNRIRDYPNIRAILAASAAIALLGAMWSVEKISLFPPGLSPRSLEMATASTSVLVDTPRSVLIDLREDTYQLTSLTNRAVIVGNVMSSPEIRDSIARRAHVPADQLRVQPPLTPKQPETLAENGNEKRTGDILKLNDQYRLAIRANPTVPVLEIFAQTPTAESAVALTNAAVDAMRDDLSRLAETDKTPVDKQIRLLQLGPAKGGVVNGGIDFQVAFLAFLLTFAAALGAILFVTRLRSSWRVTALAEHPLTR
jgi:hypothetical protein